MACGARGVYAEESVSGTWTGTTRARGYSTITYPIYDGHGTLSRYGTGSWSTTSPRFVDAWGTMRTGSATGGSPMRYCASQGHLQDDESGLVYMRARYYEPGSGRFVSEDSSRHGQNWFTYASNNPVTRGDRSGCEETVDVIGGMSLSSFLGSLGAQVNAIVLETARVGQQVWASTALDGLLAKLEENPDEWNYVEQIAINESGVQGMVKVFVKLDADQIVMKWLISSDDGENVIPYVTSYCDPDGGVGIAINPFK